MRTVLDDFLVKIAETELGKGTKVEAEHRDTIDWIRRHPNAPKKNIYRHIAGDHLEENGKYYRDLKTMENFEEKIKEAQVDPYQQKTQWTCSAACLRAVLQHYGEDWPESILVPLIGAKEKRGAECDEIAEAARMAGFMAFEYSFESVEHAKVLLDQDIPIICDIQSFNHPGKGHYVVLTHIDDEGVHLMDPNAPDLGNQRKLSLEEMEGRWWDHGMRPPHELMERWGIIIVPSDSMEKVALPEALVAPIERGLTAIKVPNLVAAGLRDVPGTPRLIMKHRGSAEAMQAGKKATRYIAENPDEALALAAPGGSAYIGAKKLLKRLWKRKHAGAGGDAASYLPRGPSPSDLVQWSASQRLGKKGMGKKSELADDGMNKIG